MAQGKCAFTSTCHDYLNRPDQLCDWPLYFFISAFSKQLIKKKETSSHIPLPDSHPQHSSHVLVPRKHITLPQAIAEIPCRPNENSSKEVKNEYACFVFAVLVSDEHDIVQNSKQTPWEALIQWVNTSNNDWDNLSKTIQHNMHVTASARKRSKEKYKQQIEKGQSVLRNEINSDDKELDNTSKASSISSSNLMLATDDDDEEEISPNIPILMNIDVNDVFNIPINPTYEDYVNIATSYLPHPSFATNPEHINFESGSTSTIASNDCHKIGELLQQTFLNTMMQDNISCKTCMHLINPNTINVAARIEILEPIYEVRDVQGPPPMVLLNRRAAGRVRLNRLSSQPELRTQQANSRTCKINNQPGSCM